MFLKSINLISLALIISIIAMGPYPVSATSYKKSSCKIFEPIDNGYISNGSHIVDFIDINLHTKYGYGVKNDVELYLYTLILRSLAIKKILDATIITRAIGSFLGLDAQILSRLPDNLYANFDLDDKFTNLADSVRKIEDLDFTIDETKFGDIVKTLCKKAVDVIELKMLYATADLKDREEIEKRYKRKSKFIIIPDFFTHELEGYPEQISTLNIRLSEYEEKLNSANSELYMYLPFFRENWLKKTWNSILSSQSPSYLFSELLIATIFWEKSPFRNFHKVEDFAKWLNSGINNEKDYDDYKAFYKTTRQTREEIEAGNIPPFIYDKALDALRIAIAESIKNQNNTLEFLAENTHIVSKGMMRELGSMDPEKPSKTKMYRKLPEHLAFLSEFPGLKQEAIDKYSDGVVLNPDKINFLHHRLEAIYKGQETDDKSWLGLARAGAIIVSLLVPGGVLAVMAILAVPEIINAVTSINKSICTNRETEVLLSLYDSEHSLSGLKSVSTFNDYLRWMERRGKYATDAYNSVTYGVFHAVLGGLLIGKGINPQLRSSITTFSSLPTRANAVRSLLVLFVTGFWMWNMIGDAFPEGGIMPQPIIEFQKTNEVLSDPEIKSKVSDKISNTIAYLLKNMEGKKDDLGFREFLTQIFKDKEYPVVPNDRGRTFFHRVNSDETAAFLNYEFLLKDETSVENLAFEIAYYFYLDRTTDYIEEQMVSADLSFEMLMAEFSGGRLSKSTQDIISGLEFRKEPDLDKYMRDGLGPLLVSAHNYAQSVGGIRIPERDYYGIGRERF